MKRIKQELRGTIDYLHSRGGVLLGLLYIIVIHTLAIVGMAYFIEKNSDFELGEDQVSELSASSTETSKGYGGSPLFKDDE
mgnify:CR=1 FL=1|tara:strand:+ start:9907 stop:10149 length:243 start_codon:yes stop_codon:yes gene_type:complete